MSQMQSASVASNCEVPPLASVSPAEWLAVCRARCNVLLEGPKASTEAVLLELMPHLGAAVQWDHRVALDLPRSGVRTLVVRDVSELQANEQKALYRWFAAPRHAQIISTTARPLFPLVERRLFDEGLYYRLNVVLLHLE